MSCLCADYVFAIDDGEATSVEFTSNDRGLKLESGSGMSSRNERCNELMFELRLFLWMYFEPYFY